MSCLPLSLKDTDAGEPGTGGGSGKDGAARRGSLCFRRHKADHAFGKSLFLGSVSYFYFNMFYLLTWALHQADDNMATAFLEPGSCAQYEVRGWSWWEGSSSPWDG